MSMKCFGNGTARDGFLIDFLRQAASLLTIVSGLQLGDVILDPRRVIYIPSLKAVVCCGLKQALSIGIGSGLRGVLERVDSAMEDYRPESLLILGPLRQGTALPGIARRWGRKSKILFIADNPDAQALAAAEAHGCEVHQQLAWDRYRFVEAESEMALDLKVMTVTGGRGYGIRIGKTLFGGMKLSVFLKGLGRLILPSMDPSSSPVSVFQPSLHRHDVFAVGYARVLPLGKVADLQKSVRFGGGLPVNKATLGARRRHGKTLV